MIEVKITLSPVLSKHPQADFYEKPKKKVVFIFNSDGDKFTCGDKKLLEQARELLSDAIKRIAE